MVRHSIEQPETPPPHPGRRMPMTYEAWRRWQGYEGKSEWVAGEVIVFMPATARQGDATGFLYVLLLSYVRFRGLGRVFSETMEMVLGERSRVPDVLFIKNTHLDRLRETRLIGAADLAVEVTSDDSEKRDFEEKKAEYEAAGVSEYWAYDARPGKRRAEFYRLVNGVYQPILLDEEGRMWSTVVAGFWLKPAWLWAEPLPDPIDCLIEIAPDYLAAKVRRAGGGDPTGNVETDVRWAWRG